MEVKNGKIAWAGELMLIGASWSDKDGHMVKLKIVSPNEEKPNPFKAFTKRKGGKAGTRFFASVAHVQGLRDRESAYAGEFMLAGWQDSSTGGYSVTFWCEPPEDGDKRVHLFEGYRRGADTFMVALVELGDDDAAVDQFKRARVEQAEREAEREADPSEAEQRSQRKGQRLSQVAAMLCQYVVFWSWIGEVDPGYSKVASSEMAASWMRERLGIESRREIDNDPAVAERFHAVIRRPFVEWQEENPGARKVLQSVENGR